MMLASVFKTMLSLLLLSSLFSCAIETKQEPVKKIIKEEKIKIDEFVFQQFNQSRILLKDKKYPAAIDLLTQVVNKEKRFAAPFVNLGMAYARLDNVAKAEEYLRKALEIDLGHVVANNELGILYRKQGRFNDAQKAYENALAQHPENLLVIRNLGILCDLYLRDLTCAQQQYETYLDIKEDKNIKIWLLDLKRRQQ